MSLPPYLQPGDKVVLYDQHCRFCTLWSGFLARRADHRLRLLAAQSAEGLAILDWFGLAPDHFDTWLFVDGAYACDDNDALLEAHQPADPYLPWPLTRANADDCATRYPTPSSTLSWSPRISPGE